MRGLRTLCRALAVLLTTAAGPAFAQPVSLPPAADDTAPQISLLTFGPGEIYWQRFGHNALLVRSVDGRDGQVYNYGIFDFHQKNFFLNFARGHMLYRLARMPLVPTLDQYAEEGRWVVEQELDLDAAQRTALAAFLANNALPQNAEYRYDYFVANCSTRVRDALDQVLGGQIQAQLQQRATPISYRGEVLELMAPEPPLMFGMDLGLGAVVDAPLDQWQDGFIPMRLRLALREVRIDRGSASERPLVRLERELVRVPGVNVEEAGSLTPPAPAVLPFLLAGLGWAVLLVVSAWLLPRALFALLATVQVFAGGLAGLVLLLGWVATDHWGMAQNLNLLLLNPLWLLLLPAALAQFRRQPRQRSPRLALILGLAVIASLPALYFGEQGNAHWIALLLPAQLALLSGLYRRRQP